MSVLVVCSVRRPLGTEASAPSSLIFIKNKRRSIAEYFKSRPRTASRLCSPPTLLSRKINRISRWSLQGFHCRNQADEENSTGRFQKALVQRSRLRCDRGGFRHSLS